MTLEELLLTDDYIGLTDVEAAELANSKRHPSTADSWWTYRDLAGHNGVGPDITRRLIETIDVAATTDKLVAEMIYSLRTDPGLNANDDATKAMLDAFAASQLPLTESDAAAIKALADTTVSDAEINGLGVVEDKQVRWARG